VERRSPFASGVVCLGLREPDGAEAGGLARRSFLSTLRTWLAPSARVPSGDSGTRRAEHEQKSDSAPDQGSPHDDPPFGRAGVAHPEGLPTAGEFGSLDPEISIGDHLDGRLGQEGLAPIQLEEAHTAGMPRAELYVVNDWLRR